jgi:phosphoribosylformimino-5-aminoimidazole carboxamide ribotide isomerase
MMAGPNLALYARLCAAAPGLAWIASGGVRDRADVAALRAVGVAGAVVGRAVLDDPARLPEMLAC